MTGPIIKKEAAGKKAWCACGMTENKPYCDGSHSRSSTNLQPLIVDIPEEANIAWCGCAKSSNKPYCDGSHRTPDQ